MSKQTQISSQAHEVLGKLTSAFTKITTIRLIISAFIIAWGVAVTYFYRKSKNTEDKATVAFYHKVWFGDFSIFQTLFVLWMFTILFGLITIFLPSARMLYDLMQSNKHLLLKYL